MSYDVLKRIADEISEEALVLWDRDVAPLIPTSCAMITLRPIFDDRWQAIFIGAVCSYDESLLHAARFIDGRWISSMAGDFK